MGESLKVWAPPRYARVGLSRFAPSRAMTRLGPSGFDPWRDFRGLSHFDVQVSTNPPSQKRASMAQKLELKGSHNHLPVALGDKGFGALERCGLLLLRCCKETRQRCARDDIGAVTRALESDPTGSGRSAVLKLSTAQHAHA
jgi:hypothetical protein